MAVKIIFIGSPLGGDDGIGPVLYCELKGNPKLKNFELLELGVIGFDMISYVEDDDELIIVDAVRTNKKSDVGKIILLGEKDLKPDLSLISQHDFGIEQTALLLRVYKPKLKKINIIGIKVYKIQPFSDKLSKELLEKISEIKKNVLNQIIKITKKN